VFKDGFPEAWCFSKHDVFSDEGFEDLVFEKFIDAVFNFTVKVAVFIYHGADDSGYFNIWVEAFFYEFDCVEEFADAFKREVVCLNWDEDLFCVG